MSKERIATSSVMLNPQPIPPGKKKNRKEDKEKQEEKEVEELKEKQQVDVAYRPIG